MRTLFTDMLMGSILKLNKTKNFAQYFKGICMRIIFGHVNQLKASVFRDHLPAEDAWPIVFTKLAECVFEPLGHAGDVIANVAI